MMLVTRGLLVCLLLSFGTCREPDASIVPIDISQNDGRSEYPTCAIDSRGTVHVVWDDDSGQPQWFSEILHSCKSPGGSWTTPTNISHSPQPGRFASVAIGPDDRTHVAWQDGSPDGFWRIFYSYEDSNGVWTAPETIAGSEQFVHPRIAVDATGQVHAVWISGGYRSRINYATRAIAGGWTQPEIITDRDTVIAEDPVLTIDKNYGNLYLAFLGLPPSIGSADIWFAFKLAGGNWSTPENISHTEHAMSAPGLAIDGQGNVCAAWNDDSPDVVGGLYKMRSTDGEWSLARSILTPTRTASVHAAHLFASPDGMIYMPARVRDVKNEKTYEAYTVKLPGGEWSEPIVVGVQKLDPYGMDPEATAVDRDGVFYLIGHKTPDVEHLDYPDIFCMEYQARGR